MISPAGIKLAGDMSDIFNIKMAQREKVKKFFLELDNVKKEPQSFS